MKVKHKRWAILLLLASVATRGQGQLLPDNGLNAEQTEFIFTKLKDFPIGTQSSIVIIKDGKANFTGTLKTNEDTLIFFDNRDKIFEIGSITKVFTSTILAHLVLDGKCSLDDGFQKYLNYKTSAEQPITLRSLANHTSGLPPLPGNMTASRMLNPQNPYKAYGEYQLREYLTTDLKKVKGEGEKINYSNLAVGLLGHILTRISGNDYESLLKKYVTEKLGMSHTTTKREGLDSALVGGLDNAGKPTPNWDLNVLVGAGGILSNAEDMSRFALAQIEAKDEAIRLTQQKTHTDNETTSIGLGWFLLSNLQSKRESLFHNGGTGGYTSSMLLDVKNKCGIIILTNISAYSLNNRRVDELCFGLLKSLDPE